MIKISPVVVKSRGISLFVLAKYPNGRLKNCQNNTLRRI